MQTSIKISHYTAAKRNLWRLCELEVLGEYQNLITNFCAEDNTESTWKNLEQCLFTGVDNVFGKTKGG